MDPAVPCHSSSGLPRHLHMEKGAEGRFNGMFISCISQLFSDDSFSGVLLCRSLNAAAYGFKRRHSDEAST